MVNQLAIRKQLEIEIMVVLEDSGIEEKVELTDTFCPIGGVGYYFDSLNAIEIAVSLSEKFDCDIGYECFFSKKENRGLTLVEITERISSKVNN